MTRRRLAVACVAALPAALAAPAWACGACVEDKVAATYDHAVMQRAAAAGDLVVFCEIKGRFDLARVTRAARQLRGVRRGSVRVSREPAAMSFALDARAQPAQRAVDALQRALPPDVGLAIIRTVAVGGR